MKRGVLILILGMFQAATFAQKNIKTDVLIIGANNAAAAAAIQSVVSGVNAVLLSDTTIALSKPEGANLSGIAFTLSKKVTETGDANLAHVFKTWTDSLKNLQFLESTSWEKLERSGTGWKVRIEDGRTIKAKVLIYAIPTDRTIALKIERSRPSIAFNYNSNIYRTSVGTDVLNREITIVPAFSLVSSSNKNLVLANSSTASYSEGQAAGATAAYGAFYNVDASQPNMKAIQGELLNYKQSLLPFYDVKPIDTNWRAIQEFALSGMLKAKIKDGKAYFMPEEVVQFGEIAPTLKELYYKAQIWLEDHKGVPMNLENVLSMISYVGNKSAENTLEQIKKQWKTSYQFKSDFSLDKPLTRREFAVIIRDYLKPFDVNLDKGGRVLR